MAKGKRPPRETQLSILKMWNGEKAEVTAQEGESSAGSKDGDIPPSAPKRRTRNRLKVIAEEIEVASISSDSTTTFECLTDPGAEPLTSQNSEVTVVPSAGERTVNAPPKSLFPIFSKQVKETLEILTDKSPSENALPETNIANEKDVSNTSTRRSSKRLKRSVTDEGTSGSRKSSEMISMKRTASVRVEWSSIGPKSLRGAVSPEVELIGERTRTPPLPNEVLELICIDDFPIPHPGSQQNPISLESSVEQRQVKPRTSTSAPVNKFFAPRKAVQKLKKVGEGIDPLWPSYESTHVRGDQTFIGNRVAPRLRPTGSFVEGSSRDGIKSFTTLPAETRDPETHYMPRILCNDEQKAKLEAIAAARPETQAIKRFSSYLTSIDSFQSPQVTWCEKWRPRRASEVLGNESHSEFIKQWLLALALEVHSKLPIKTGADTTERKNADENGNSETVLNAARGKKRPKVMRAVDKTLRRKRQRVESDDEDLDDWIVEDDMEETPGPDVFDSEDELLFHGMLTAIRSSASPEKPRRLTRLSRKEMTENVKEEPQTEVDVITPQSDPVPAVDVSISAPSQQSGSVEGTASVQHDFSSHLTNTILLVGPSGIGKTASVHACAEELGWEIFEVYPGVGKRNGTNLMNLVGDIGKNHFLGGAGNAGKGNGSRRENNDIFNSKAPSGHQPQNTRKLDTFFSMSKSLLPAEEQKDGVDTDTREGLSGIFADCMNTQGLGFLTSTTALNKYDMENDAAGNIAARQSIILIEEADVLFNEDTNFWPTVVNLIKESMRPVILTCNDIGLIPLADLPLQAVLNFQPCPDSLAKDYLTAMTIAEGFSVPKSFTEQAYGPSRLFCSADTAIELAKSRNSCAILPHADLRRAINNLQFLCESSPEFQSGASASREDEKGRVSGSTEDVTIVKDDGGGDLDLLSDWTLGFQESGGANQMKPKEVFHRLEQFSDAVSFLDSNVRRRCDADLEAYAFDVSPSDVEAGYTQLICQKFSDNLESGIAFFNRDNAMALEGTLCARKIVGTVASGSPTRRSRTGDISTSLDSNVLLERRASYLSHVAECLGGLGLFPFVQNIDELVVDYEPHIRAMVAADDRLEAAELLAMQARATHLSGRSTRNSQRQMQYVRWIGLNEIAREALRQIGFRVDDTFSGVDG